ncbi:DUF2752 domain-containing protein [Actinomadura montaniterrae]|uniref:DUF2752 domain-containing protein n=1 Tax=Actinomadura montaniterrae TaxID=1803903 RepID=A0A6L3VLP8_9ACTN|nr:DUF2752 domain-containing protein [Actinomadura montaniterrae]KAB2367638.1 DUF2752 domain-containing protein [Actinomadura montaniterrae]
MSRAAVPVPPQTTSRAVRKGPVRALTPHGIVLAGAAAATVLVAVVDPNRPGHYPTCPFLAMTGYYCPGCGAMRLVNALAHGHAGTAFGFNPLLFLLLPVFGYLYVRWTVLSLKGRPMWSALFRPVAVYCFVGVVAAYWIVRNLPFAHALAP